MNHLERILNYIDLYLRRLLALMMVLLVIDVTWQVLTRFVLPQPSSFTEEVARYLLIWISLLGGAYAYRQQSHLGFDLIVKSISAVKAKFLYRLCCVLVAIFAISVLIIGGLNLVHLTWTLNQHSAVLNIPMAGIYTVLPISGLLFLLYSINFFVNPDKSLALEEDIT